MKKYIIAGTAAAALALAPLGFALGTASAQTDSSNAQQTEIGRASCRERV